MAHDPIDGPPGEFDEFNKRWAERNAHLFEPNPDHVAPPDMKRSIHRSHRGEGYNDGVGE